MRVLFKTAFVAFALVLGAPVLTNGASLGDMIVNQDKGGRLAPSPSSNTPLVINITLPAVPSSVRGRPMKLSGNTTQPIGHYEFCRQHPGECGKMQMSEPASLTKAVWKQLLEVNAAVNREILPMTDDEVHGKDEVWSYVTGFGDCEDYALEKRRRLVALGWDPSTLLITVVKRANGDGHAILTLRARNSHGQVDLVLDNLDERILRWQDTSYHFIKRQSARHAGRWESINDSRDLHTAAAN